MSSVVVDNDVLLKTATYGFATALIEAHLLGASTYLALGASRFIIPKRLAKRPPNRGAAAAQADFEAAMMLIQVVEPTESEVLLAGELEYIAMTNNLSLDVGECLLCAILAHRACDFFFTGDKRAIVALERMFSAGHCPSVEGKLVCMEQLALALLGIGEPQAIRQAVCSEPATDKALTNCFACSSPSPTLDHLLEGLMSYIGSLRNQAPLVLHSTIDS